MEYDNMAFKLLSGVGNIVTLLTGYISILFFFITPCLVTFITVEVTRVVHFFGVSNSCDVVEDRKVPQPSLDNFLLFFIHYLVAFQICAGAGNVFTCTTFEFSYLWTFSTLS